MIHFLGFLFITIVIILLLGISIISTILRRIFGLGGKRHDYSRTSQYGDNDYQTSQGYSFSGNRQQDYSSEDDEEVRPMEGDTNKKHKKLFSEDEGEYIDFEEIKE